MKREKVLAECIAEVRAGHSTIEECLARHPEISAELRPLLQIALSLKPKETSISAEFRVRARAAVLQVMQEDKDGYETGRTRWLRPVFSLKAAPVLIGVLAAVIAGGSTVYAAQRTLPGDALYPVKTATENVQLAFTFGPQAKALLHLRLAERRVDETATETSLKRSASPSAPATVATQLDDALSEIGKSKPEDVKHFMQRLADNSLRGELTIAGLTPAQSSQTQPVLSEMASILRRGNLIAGVTYDNPAFLATEPSVLDSDLEAGQFKLTGTLTAVHSQTWTVNGVTLDNVVYSGTPPAANSQVMTEGITRKGKTFITSIEPEDIAPGQVTIQGIIQGNQSGGQVWNLGGIPVTVAPGTASPPQQGDEVRLSGTPSDGKVSVSEIQSGQPDNAGVEVDGTISSVDVSGNWIYVKRAGVQVKVNTSGAILNTEDQQPITMSDLQSSQGRGVEIRGLYKKDGVLYAKQVRVEESHGRGKGKQ